MCSNLFFGSQDRQVDFQKGVLFHPTSTRFLFWNDIRGGFSLFKKIWRICASWVPRAGPHELENGGSQGEGGRIPATMRGTEAARARHKSIGIQQKTNKEK